MDIQKIPAIQQKRIVTFVNHFIIDTVTHLNKFIESYENSFWKLEKRMRKLETSLKLIETKLNFIPGIEEQCTSNSSVMVNQDKRIDVSQEGIKEELSVDITPDEVAENPVKIIPEEIQKYIKMHQVGVPLPAVKLKMQIEGVDPVSLDLYL